ncbi:MAG: sensor histidine kinase [Armatimonadetes bacterium]|nr:sensor histidine kinase [Armatimonadota bacterium]
MEALKRDGAEQERFSRVSGVVWLIVLGAIGWGVLRHLQGAFEIGWGGILLLSALGIVSAGARTWVGLRDPRTMFSFTMPLVMYDIGVITLAVRLTGGIESEAWLLYFALLVSEAAVMSTVVLLMMLALTGVGYGFAVAPISDSSVWVDFGYRLLALSLTTWLVHLVLRAHKEYQLELAQLRQERQLAQERERIAQEFHDGLGATLSRVVMALEAFCLQSQRIHALSDEQLQYLQEQISQLREANYETRLIIRQLEPKHGLNAFEQVRLIAQRTARQLGATLHFEAPEAMPALTPLQALMLTRVMQEALTNTLKHAPNTRTLWVCFKREGNTLWGCVQDDGDGFEPDIAVGGFGLQHMRERIESLGGVLQISSQPGAGTRVEFRIPIGGEK